MLDIVANVIRRECGLNKGRLTLIGVSGGADSLFLLDLLHQFGYRLIIAHFDHGIRPEALNDASVVQNVAEVLGLPVVIGRGSVPKHVEEHKISIEEAARILRYKFLFDQAEAHNCQAVAVAHNADDQVETVLMHILRGSGLDGLSGMANHWVPNPWSDTIPLVRPLLNVWREEIDDYLQSRKLVPVLDRTNLDTRYLRNRLRHKLIPTLDTYIPGIKNRLWQTSELVKHDQSVIENLVVQASGELFIDRGLGYLAFSLSGFKLQPLAIQRRLVRLAASEIISKARDIDFAFVQRVLDFVLNPTSSSQVDVGLGLRALREGDYIYLAFWDVDLPLNSWPQVSSEVDLSIPCEIHLNAAWVLRIEAEEDLDSARNLAKNNDNPEVAWVDLISRNPRLTLRGRVPGDRFQPLGFSGKSMKLSDFMINLKIPQRARDGWPLVCMDDEIAWVAGQRLADPFRLKDRTSWAIKCSIKNKNQ